MNMLVAIDFSIGFIIAVVMVITNARMLWKGHGGTSHVLIMFLLSFIFWPVIIIFLCFNAQDWMKRHSMPERFK